MRVIAATHQDMEKLVRDGKFRDDLYYRLNVVLIDIPPLRERQEDIPVLVAHFCQKFARIGSKPAEVTPEAMDVLLKCPWPGNVRQLENAIERACVTARDGLITPKNLPPDVGLPANGKPHPFQIDLSRPLPELLAEMTTEFEKRLSPPGAQADTRPRGQVREISGLSRRQHHRQDRPLRDQKGRLQAGMSELL